MKPTKKLPLFIITGASGAGKSAACEILFKSEKEYIVLESDIWWHDVFDTPDDKYRKYREKWLEMCAAVSQIGMPCVLCGCTEPSQLEFLPQREFFTEIYYLAVVCDKQSLTQKLTAGRKISDAAHIKSSLDFNEWLKNNAEKTKPCITLLDNSLLTPAETAEKINLWIKEKIC